jgi:hypothetical protein
MRFELVIHPNILVFLGKLVKFMLELVGTLTKDDIVMILMDGAGCLKETFGHQREAIGAMCDPHSRIEPLF